MPILTALARMVWAVAPSDARPVALGLLIILVAGGGDGMIGHIGPVTRGQRKKQARNAEIEQEFDTMLHGHFHTYSPGRRIIGNGSLVGYGEYSNQANFDVEPPIQAMWITHPEHGITYHIPLYVDEPSGRKPGEWVSVFK